MRYRELLEAQKNNADFMALSQRVTDLEKQLRNKTREKDEESKSVTDWKRKSSRKERQRDVSGERSGRAETSGRRTKLNRSAAEQAITEYDRYLAGEDKKAASCAA